MDLLGNGLGAVATVTPQAVDFGEVEVGQTSPLAAITVENLGNAALEIGDLAFAGEDSEAFSLAGDEPVLSVDRGACQSRSDSGLR